MAKKIGISLMLLILSACVTTPDETDYSVAAEEHASLKVAVPEYVPANIKGMDSVKCDEGQCVMSESDYRQSQFDKKRMYNAYKFGYELDVMRVTSINAWVDAYTHTQVALAKRDRESDELRQALKEERTFNFIKNVVEKALFIGGVFIFGTL